MRHFLALSSIRFAIVVVQQTDDGRKFNRGQLLNIGFVEAKRFFGSQRMSSAIFHDVDLLPSARLLPCYEEVPQCGRPHHLSCANTWWKVAGMLGGYRELFLGGVTAFAPADFEACNGFPNDYWGWGLEDDQLRLRAAQAACLTGGIKRPGSCVGTYTDIDVGCNNLNILQGAKRDEQPHLWNRKFLETRSVDGRYVLDLDVDWDGAAGIRGLRYHVQARVRMQPEELETLAPPFVRDGRARESEGPCHSESISESVDEHQSGLNDDTGEVELIWVVAELGE